MEEADGLRSYTPESAALVVKLRSSAQLDAATVRNASRDWDPWVRRALAERAESFASALPEVVLALVRDRDPMVVAAAVQYAPLSSAQLEELASSGELTVRRSLAGRAGELPEAVVRRLAADPDSLVREFVARRPDLVATVRETLARDERWNVREAASSEPESTIAARGESADELADLLAQLGPQADRGLRAAVAAHPLDVPLDVLLSLAGDDDPVVRIRVAFRPQPLHVEVIEVLARDPNAEVRLTVAERRDLPSTVREDLLSDSDPLVRAAAASS